MEIKVPDYVRNGMRYTTKFLFHTFLSVVWYAICAIAAKVICLLRDLLNIEGYEIMVWPFRILEWFFLILGVVIAISYFSVETYKLICEIHRCGSDKRRGG